MQYDPVFVRLFEEVKPKILRYLSQVTGDEEEAKDLVQMTFLNASKGWESFRSQAKASTWFYRVATNVARDKARSKERHHKNAVILEPEVHDKVISSPYAGEKPQSVEGQAIRREMNDCIREMVWKLPHSLKTVLILSDLEEMKAQEVASILDLPLSNVKSRLHRARTQLKKLMESNCCFFLDERNELACDRKIASDDH